MTPDRTEQLCAWVASIAIVIGFAAGNTRNFQTRILPNDLDSPVLAMELLENHDDLSKIVGSPSDKKNNREQMKQLTYIDFAFIAAYACLFLLAALRLWQRSWRFTAVLAALAGCGAAAFDVRENLLIFETLKCECTTPRGASLVKWALTFVALLLLSPVFIDRAVKPLRRFIGYIAGASTAAAGFVGLSGIGMHADPLVEVGATIMAFALLVGWLFFATRAALAGGLVAGLNRLASVYGFRKLADWREE